MNENELTERGYNDEERISYPYCVSIALISNELALRELVKLPGYIQATGDPLITRNHKIKKYVAMTERGFRSRHDGLYYCDSTNRKNNKYDELREVEVLTKKTCDDLIPVIDNMRRQFTDFLTANDCCYEECIAELIVIATLINNAIGCCDMSKRPDMTAEVALQRIAPRREESNFAEVSRAFYAWPDYLDDYIKHKPIKDAITELADRMAEAYEKNYCKTLQKEVKPRIA